MEVVEVLAIESRPLLFWHSELSVPTCNRFFSKLLQVHAQRRVALEDDIEVVNACRMLSRWPSRPMLMEDYPFGS